MNKPLKGLPVSVYRAEGHDCTLNGLSSKHERFILVGPGIPEIFEVQDDTPALYYKEDFPMAGLKRQAAWVEPQDGSQRWAMFGGNFVWTSDSRFPADAPIKIFDRFEE